MPGYINFESVWTKLYFESLLFLVYFSLFCFCWTLNVFLLQDNLTGWIVGYSNCFSPKQIPPFSFDQLPLLGVCEVGCPFPFPIAHQPQSGDETSASSAHSCSSEFPHSCPWPHLPDPPEFGIFFPDLPKGLKRRRQLSQRWDLND